MNAPDCSNRPECPQQTLALENDSFALEVDAHSGAISSLLVKSVGNDLIGEKRLRSNFRLCLPVEDCLCNYIQGMEQEPVSVSRQGDVITTVFSGMVSEKGSFPIDLEYQIRLTGDALRFRAKLTNHADEAVSEFYFPQLGGWTCFGDNRAGALAHPGYHSCSHDTPLFSGFPGGRGLGAEAAEWSMDYPGGGMVMPWISLFDPESNQSLYMGYHDQTLRMSSWHMNLFPESTGGPDAWPTPEQACGEPVGIVFSHVRYPFIHSGECFDTGEFVIRVHEGDWHHGSGFYREWFMEHFPFDKSGNWLRGQSSWFSSIIYQPEDRVVADYDQYSQWTEDAQQYGVNTFEIIGWDRGGLERQYPEYVPEDRLGGHEGWLKLLAAIREHGGRSLPFVNYNILDPNTDWYKEELHRYTHQDQFGDTPNWMAWGESTLIARKAISVRRHRLGSVVEPLEKILEDFYVQIARDGADGVQIDKLVVGSAVDFNPLLTRKPDEANFEGLVQAIDRVYHKCRAVNSDFCFAAEDLHDRMIPYVDVFYRAAMGVNICPLRFVFPEWTACQHVSSPGDFNAVNSALLTGAVICVEPGAYSESLGHPRYEALGRHIQAVEKIRSELKDTIFLGDYFDTLHAEVTELAREDHDGEEDAANQGVRGEVIVPGGDFRPQPEGHLHYRVHGNRKSGRRAIVVVNLSAQERFYNWCFLHAPVEKARVYEPYRDVFETDRADPLKIPGNGVQVLLEIGPGAVDSQ